MSRTKRRDPWKIPGLKLAQPVAFDIRPGKHEQHARDAERRGKVDPTDARMRMTRAQDITMGCVRNMDIVDEMAPAREETQVLGPQHWLADCAAHSLRWINHGNILAAASNACFVFIPLRAWPVPVPSMDRPDRRWGRSCRDDRSPAASWF